jgi:hypothetical protein
LRGVVGVEDIDSAELIEFDTGVHADAVVEIPWGEIDVVGFDEGADAAAVVALLDLVPPAFALVFDHGGLFDVHARLGAHEVEDGAVCAGDGREELPAGEDADVADVGLELADFFATF